MSLLAGQPKHSEKPTKRHVTHLVAILVRWPSSPIPKPVVRLLAGNRSSTVAVAKGSIDQHSPSAANDCSPCVYRRTHDSPRTTTGVLGTVRTDDGEAIPSRNHQIALSKTRTVNVQRVCTYEDTSTEMRNELFTSPVVAEWGAIAQECKE